MATEDLTIGPSSEHPVPESHHEGMCREKNMKKASDILQPQPFSAQGLPELTGACSEHAAIPSRFLF